MTGIARTAKNGNGETSEFVNKSYDNYKVKISISGSDRYNHSGKKLIHRENRTDSISFMMMPDMNIILLI